MRDEDRKLVSDLLDMGGGRLRDADGLLPESLLRSLRRLIDEAGSGIPEFTGFDNFIPDAPPPPNADH